MSPETRERLRLFFLAERSRIRTGHLRLAPAESFQRDAPECLNTQGPPLLYSDVLKYGADRPPTALAAMTGPCVTITLGSCVEFHLVVTT